MILMLWLCNRYKCRSSGLTKLDCNISALVDTSEVAPKSLCGGRLMDETHGSTYCTHSPIQWRHPLYTWLNSRLALWGSLSRHPAFTIAGVRNVFDHSAGCASYVNNASMR
ncbi:hypothetical protein PMIN06_005568 [Paraphaeosphaeria minitans]